MQQGDERATPGPNSKAAFPSTRWSLIHELKDSDTETAWKALCELCDAYWPPLYAYARRKGHTRQDSEDLVQGVLSQLCARESFFQFSRQPDARFRTWLLRCLQKFEIGEWRKRSAEKRGGDCFHVAIDFQDGDGGAAWEPGDNQSPESAFDAAFSQRLCQRAFEQLRAEQERTGNTELYNQLKPFLLRPNSGGTMEFYTELGARFGMSAAGVAKRQERLRTRFAEIVRGEVAQLVSDESEVQDEIRHLIQALA